MYVVFIQSGEKIDKTYCLESYNKLWNKNNPKNMIAFRHINAFSGHALRMPSRNMGTTKLSKLVDRTYNEFDKHSEIQYRDLNIMTRQIQEMDRVEPANELEEWVHHCDTMDLKQQIRKKLDDIHHTDYALELLKELRKCI
jgi:hypothetical protein